MGGWDRSQLKWGKEHSAVLIILLDNILQRLWYTKDNIDVLMCYQKDRNKWGNKFEKVSNLMTRLICLYLFLSERCVVDKSTFKKRAILNPPLLYMYGDKVVGKQSNREPFYDFNSKLAKVMPKLLCPFTLWATERNMICFKIQPYIGFWLGEMINAKLSNSV